MTILITKIIKMGVRIKRGDTVNIPVTITQADGDALDITGYTALFTVKSIGLIDEIDASDANALIKKEFSSFSDPTNGKFIISLSNTETAVIVGKHKADIQLNKSDTIISTINFDFEILSEATQRIA